MASFILPVLVGLASSVISSLRLKNKNGSVNYRSVVPAENGSYVAEPYGNSILDDLVNRYTGNGLTTAQREQNAYTSAENLAAFNRERSLYAERYQLATEDMIKAGLNPAMMYGQNALGSGVSAPITGSQSVPGIGLGELINSIAALRGQSIEKKLREQQNNIFQQQIEVERYNAETHRLEVESNKQRNEVLNRLTGLQSENQQLANYILQNTKDLEIEKVQKYVDNLSIQFDLYAAQVHSEEEKADYYVASAAFQKMSAEQIRTLLPYLQRIQSANAESAEYEKDVAFVERHISLILGESSYIDDVKEAARSKMQSAKMSKEWQDELMHSNRLDAKIGRVLRRMGISGNAALMSAGSAANSAAAAASAAANAPTPVKGFIRGYP